MSRKRRLLIFLAVPLVPVLILFLLGQYLIWYGSRDRAQPADAILIFGARVWPGGEPSPILQARTRRAYELWLRGLAPRIICTGGVGDDPPAEAEVQAKLLRGWGVPERAILVENHSTSTRENVEFAAKLLPVDERTIIGVSDAFHLWRCVRECRKQGIIAYSSPSPGFDELPMHSRLYYAFREAVLMLRSLIVG